MSVEGLLKEYYLIEFSFKMRNELICFYYKGNFN